jgi:hypothetical protein
MFHFEVEWTFPCSCGRDQQVWPSISTSSSPSLRPLAPLKSCSGFALHLPNIVVTTSFFQWIAAIPIVDSIFLGKCFVLAFQLLHLHIVNLNILSIKLKNCSMTFRFACFYWRVHCSSTCFKLMELKILSISISWLCNSSNSLW